MSASQRVLAAALFASVATASFQFARGQVGAGPTPGNLPLPPEMIQEDKQIAPPTPPVPPNTTPGAPHQDAGLGMPQGTPPADWSQQVQGSPAPSQSPPPTASPGETTVTPVAAPTPAEKGQYATHALLKTSEGPIEILLYEAEAPLNVGNFIDLVKGAREFVDVTTSKKVMRPFYNGLIFHRVVPGFLIQTGCPFGTGRGGPGYTMPDEISQALKHDKPGVVAMAPARTDKGIQKDTNGSQFYITLNKAPELDGKATIIGQVIKGLDVVQKISRKPVGPTERPIKKVHLYSVDITQVELGRGKKKQ